MIENYRKRQIYIFYLLILTGLSIISLRLIYLQIFRSPALTKFARSQHLMHIPLEAKRGTIFDRNMKPLAFNLPIPSVFANPKEIKDPIYTAEAISRILNLDKNILCEKFAQQDKSFVWIARHIKEETAKAIEKLALKGIYLIKETKRYYPQANSGSTVLGFCGIDNNGLEGIELKYDQQLRGRPGYLISAKDAKRRRLFFLNYDYLPPVDGCDLVLTIDSVIQYIAERELEMAVKTTNARGGSVVVVSPFSGEILAMANYPNFNPNHPGDFDKDKLRNRAITDMFEPGSSFKIVTASAAIEEGITHTKERFFCENGSYNMKTHVLHDHQPHGWLTFAEVIGYSSNIGTVKVAQKLGLDRLYPYIYAFGIGKRTGIELPGEADGFVRPLNELSKTSIGAIPIGQEVMVTPLQLTMAMCVIANGGYLIEPHIVKEVRDSKGIPLKISPPQKMKRVLSPSTAEVMAQILKGVVEFGTGKLARLKEYTCAGKTGTAQKVENGIYSHRKFVSSFIGFVPLENPQLVIGVVLDEPHPYYGGVVCAPVFKHIANEALKYLDSLSWDLKFVKDN
ncbi:MAG: penicillin-binding transpeptidase domain-containing protein [Candidatus Omnitrophica bacterium]|nr:penicillin-binding transpeptidase domain-containing protein [Candidatus Omnitrophota bacterium]MCM8798462.1 penicillin-binding transpeptidase domain-containing protein [Candidatus Omnitrophota bacterium]